MGTILAVAKALEGAEADLTAWDKVAGDGDCGITMQRGAQALISGIEGYPVHDAVALPRALADSISGSMGGTSGALIEIGLRAAASEMARVSSSSGSGYTPGGLDSSLAWSGAFLAGCEAIQFYGGAERGYRTMLDALLPAADALKAGDSLTAAAKAAMAGAE